jgi:TRAP-type C4-dicarboxylate transport system substrate-binding protein
VPSGDDRRHDLAEILSGHQISHAHPPRAIFEAFIVSSKFLAKLSPADADIVAEAGRPASDHQAKVDADEEAQTITDLKSKGIEIVETVNRKSFIDAVAPVYDTAINRFGDSKSPVKP